MMSVNDLFYGNQHTPTRILRASPTQVKHQNSPYGTRSPYSHDSPLSRDDHHDTVQQAQSRNYSTPSSLNSARYQQDYQLPVEAKYTPSAYISSAARDNDDDLPDSMRVNLLRSNFSIDFSSPSYSRQSSRGGSSTPVSTWIELRVPICCESCVERVNSRLLDLRGVESVTCDLRKQRVVVRGTAAASEVLKMCKKLFKRSEFWRYQYDWS